jgi:hypothetical protein
MPAPRTYSFGHNSTIVSVRRSDVSSKSDAFSSTSHLILWVVAQVMFRFRTKEWDA